MLSPYHQKYASQPDMEIVSRIKAKQEEIRIIFSQVTKPPQHDGPARVAVLGCADVRYLPEHQKMFEQVLWLPTEVTTFDITIEHLAGAERVVAHDCTEPLPDPPYDITYAHVLLKFIPTERQGALIINAYQALRSGGVAIIITDQEDDQSDKLPDDQYHVPLEKWRKLLEQQGIKLVEMQVPYKGLAWVLVKPEQ